MKKLIIAFLSAFVLTVLIEGYNYLRGDELLTVARGIKIFVTNFVIFSIIFFFVKHEKEKATTL